MQHRWIVRREVAKVERESSTRSAPTTIRTLAGTNNTIHGTTESMSEGDQMRFHGIAAGLVGLCLLSPAASLQAETIVEDTFTGYPDNALISADPAGPANGLIGNWTLVPDSNFYVNKTQLDPDAGTGKAVYDRPSGDNGARTATRDTTVEHVLYETDGDLFYASFLIEPARADGDMTFELELVNLDGGGAVDFSFGISGGTYIVGNGGISAVASGGMVTANEQLVVVRIEYGDTSSGGLDDDEVVTLWVDAVDESSPPVIDGFSNELLNSGGGKILSVSIRGDQMNGQPALFDDLRIGLSFAEVMPWTLFADGFESGTTDLWSSVTQ